MENVTKPESIAFQYSSYNLEEPTRNSEDYCAAPKISSNTYILNSEENNLDSQANSIRSSKKINSRNPLLFNKRWNGNDQYHKPYKSLTGTVEYQELENDDETKVCSLDGDESKVDVGTDDEYNFENGQSFNSPNDWQPETDEFMSFGDYIRKNYDKAEHLYAHLGNSLDDAEYYFIKKSDEDLAQKSNMFFGNSQYGPEGNNKNMKGDQAMFGDKYIYNGNVNYPPEEFVYDYIPKKEQRANSSFRHFSQSYPEKLSKDSHLNSKSFNAQKDNVYKEALDKVNEAMSELKCAGLEDKTKPFRSSSENLKKIQRHSEKKAVSIQTNEPKANQRIGVQKSFTSEIQRKQDPMNYSLSDIMNKFGKRFNLNKKLDNNNDPQLSSRPQKLNPSK